MVTSDKRPQPSIRIGLLHSLSGTMAIAERSLLDVERLVIDEINAKGGVMGHRVVPIVADGESRAEVFATRAQELLSRDIASIFGCWTSASRKAVKPLVEAAGGLLWYPLQYEGLEESPNIIYTGASLNQQITPALEWASEALGKTVFLVGSDYVFPRTTNLLARVLMERDGGAPRVLGERYVPLGAQSLDDVVAEIGLARPDFVFNTLNGDSNLAFFRALSRAGLIVSGIPPDIAEAMVDLGLSLEGLTTAISLEAGLRTALESLPDQETPSSGPAGGA